MNIKKLNEGADYFYYSTNRQDLSDFYVINGIKPNGNLIYLHADDESLILKNTPCKSKEEYIKALEESYEVVMELMKKQGEVHLGLGSTRKVPVLNYGNLEIYEEEFPQSAQECKNWVIECFEESYIDGDSAPVVGFIDPNSMKVVLGGSIELEAYS